MSNFIDFLLVISKLQSPIYRRSPQSEDDQQLTSDSNETVKCGGRLALVVHPLPR